MNKAELQNLRDRAQDTIAQIDKALASMTEKPTPTRPFRRGEPVIMWDDEKPTPERPFRRGEPVITWDDEKYKFMGFFVEHTDGGFVVSVNPEPLHPLTTKWRHCKHLPPFIDWSLVEPHFRYAAEYDSGMVAARSYAPEVGNKNGYGTIVAVHKRPEETK